MRYINDLISCLYNYKKLGATNPLITSIEMDSREIREGSLFICIRGFTVDGHNYIDEAIQRGAAAILSEEERTAAVPIIVVKDTKRAMAMLANVFYDHPTTKLSLIGVTGTNGKTTITHLIEKIVTEANKKTGLIGTMYMKIGAEVYETKNTTPESLALQAFFAKMVESDVDTAIMEVSSHALHLGRVRGCNFTTAVFSNLTQDHLDYHQTMDAYRQAKGLLFSQLGNTYCGSRQKFAVLNSDDPASGEFAAMTAAQVITYGIENACDVRASNIHISAQGTSFTLEVFGKKASISLKMVGIFSVYNALAAIAACLAEGVPLEAVINSLEDIEGVAGRFQLVNAGQSFTIIVDYAHTPDSLENALTTIRQFVEGKIHVVVGCGGDRDKTKRPIMAKIADQLADYVILTSDNPRSEDPKQIICDMEAGLVKESQHKSFVDRKAAIMYALRQAEENDVVLIAGKGHETYQIIGSESSFFDDRLVAAEVVKELLHNER